jgi:hypothetical protein
MDPRRVFLHLDLFVARPVTNDGSDSTVILSIQAHVVSMGHSAYTPLPTQNEKFSL